MIETTANTQPRAARQPIWLLGALLFLVAGALVAATLLLGVRNGYALTYLTFIASEPVGALVGGLIIARQPRNPVGWLIVGHAFCFTGGEFFRQYAIYGAQTAPGALPFARALVWPAYWLWGPGIACGFALLPFFFPNGRLVSPRWRIGLWLIVALMTAITLAMAFQSSEGEAAGLPNPLGVLPNLSEDAALGPFFAVPWVASALIGVASLAARFWRATPEERRPIQWLLYAVSLMLLGNWLLPKGGILGELFLTLSLAGLWASVGIAVLRYGLYDIELIINRTLVYGVLTALVVALYVAVVAYGGALLQFLGAFEGQGGFALQLVATGVVAVVFQPLRERLQRGVNRLLYGARHEPYAALAQLGQRLEGALAPDRVPALVVETVAMALRAPYVAIALHTRQGDEGAGRGGDVAASEHTFEIAASFGSRPASLSPSPLVSLPIFYAGEELGSLLLAPRAPGDAFGAADRRLLADLARQAGVALSAARLTVELQHARERLVSAREEERRRLRRDLHDGLGPTLAAQTLKVGSARHFIGRDPGRADELLAGLERDIAGALQEVRRLVYDLRPPALDDLGLLGALDLVASSYARPADDTADGPPGMRVVVTAEGPLSPLPAAVEVAAYRIAQEALVNAARHGRARHSSVRLEVPKDGDALLLTVANDGADIAAARRSGVGLHSMRERAEELGGELRVDVPPGGGTRVVARLPLVRG
jgi:signal transduction histidine kinase